ncbi:hypothetical protein CVCC1112_2338 [Paenarthrobacter nicotinovorans]|nr:hypothetical protein CVCC1112_2338 [Paenarthrobacter nicotinovorans]
MDSTSGRANQIRESALRDTSDLPGIPDVHTNSLNVIH